MATEAFFVATKIFGPDVAKKVLCHDRVWGWDRVFGSRQGSPCVATDFSLIWAIPVAIGFAGVVLR